MTATERLRALLDERGVEWSNVYTGTGDTLDNLTEWNVQDAGWVEAWEYGGYLSYTWHMGEKPSPEQAVEATLGRGTCHARNDEDTCGHDVCSECGFVWPDDYSIRYCPNCGRRVIA